MPAKLMRCINDLMDKGKSKSSAIAICVKSTGLKMEKEEIEKLLKDNKKEARSNFLETIKGENTIGFYEYRRGK